MEIPAAAVKAVASGAPAAGSLAIGLSAGAVGLGLTLWNAVRESLGTDAKLGTDLVKGPATYALGGGMGLLVLADRGILTSARANTFLRGGAMALIIGGLAGALIGTISTLNNPHDQRARSNSMIQPPVDFPPIQPSSPDDLVGIELAEAEVPLVGGGAARLPVYLDPRAARRLEVTSLADAIAFARAASQSDPEFRSHAVIRTTDDAFWTVRLTGPFDQIDGPRFTADNQFDPDAAAHLKVVKQQPALLAIAGVQTFYDFPDGIEPGAPQPAHVSGPQVPPVLPTPAGGGQ